MSTSGAGATFEITDAKLYIPIVTLKAEDNTKLSKLLSEEFKRLIYWNEYKVISNKNYNESEYIRERRDASIQEVNRLFVFPYTRGNNLATENLHNKYFIPRSKIDKYNIEIDGRNFYDEAIMTQLNNITKFENKFENNNFENKFKNV